jgi:hypothetical protein
MKQGVNKNGVEYTRLKDKTYLCRLYLGEGVQLEKILTVTPVALSKINLNDMLTNKKNK